MFWDLLLNLDLLLHNTGSLPTPTLSNRLWFRNNKDTVFENYHVQF